MLADNRIMIDTDTMAGLPALRVVQVTQHWTIEHGTFYRDCVVEDEDGTRRLVGVRDDLLSVAA